MPPQAKPKGGRPRTAWNSSRRRKLVRLYTLTSLDKDEIQRVLREDGFKPSSSDIQKKLRALLPRDYAKNYRGIRPSNDANMKLRLSHVPRRRKPRSSSSQNWPQTSITGSARHRSHKLQLKLATSTFPLARIDQSHPESSLPFESIENPGLGHWTFSASPTINPSLLFHDRSLSTETDFTQKAVELEDHIEHPPPFITTNQTVSKVVAEDHTSSERPLSRSLSLRSLVRRLTNVYSNSYMDHIRSVLSLSSGPSQSRSWRSSIVSSSSRPSSRARSSLASARQPANSAAPGGRRNPQLSRDEQAVWDELVNESSVAVAETPLFRPRYPCISLTDRPCCNLTIHGSMTERTTISRQPNDILCSECGFLMAHYMCRTFQSTEGDDTLVLRDMLQGALNAEDNYGNTPLHFMAASRNVSYASIMSLLLSGANVHARNSSGETFLHALTPRNQLPIDTLANYRSLIDLVKLRQFNLHQRDYHGRTLCHVLLEIYPKVYDPNFVCDILVILQPDINSFDNLTNCLKDIVIRRLIYKHTLSALQRFKFQDYYNPLTAILNFKEKIQCENFSMSFLNTNRQNKKLFTWVDGSGDTFLSALIKSWPIEADELGLASLVTDLLQLGSDVHMRDRHGNTPLGNAVRLGSRPVVTVLLKANSNIHIRDYNGNSIVAQAKVCLLQAQKDQDDKRYATILSCMNALVDAGAKGDPTERDELFTPTARARGANQSWTIIQRDDMALSPALHPAPFGVNS